MAGCIPVTSRVGALNETIHPEAPTIPIVKTESDLIEYRKILLNTMERIKNSETDTNIKKELINERLKIYKICETIYMGKLCR